MAGQKVEKVFGHEEQDFQEFCRRNEAFRAAATRALAYSGMTDPPLCPCPISIMPCQPLWAACLFWPG